MGKPIDVVAGALRFDSIEQVESGWASIKGGTPFRFEDINELETRCFYVSNLGFEEAFKTGIASNAKIRNTDFIDVNFFSTRERRPKKEENIYNKLKRVPNDIIGQLGIDDDDWELQTQTMSAIIDRVYSETKNIFDFKYPDFKKLAFNIRESLMKYDQVIKNDKLLDALSVSTIDYSLVQRSIDSIQPETDFGINVSLPKAKHALDILSRPLPKPTTTWTEFSKKMSAKKSKEYIESLPSHGIYLLRVNIKSISDEYAHIVNFGTGKEKRTWITGVDAQFLVKYSVLEIQQGFIADEVVEHHPIYDKISKMYNAEQHDLSFSAGILLQNIWMALTTSSMPPPNIRRQYETYNIMKPFIKSYDRLQLTETAKILDEENIIVTSYSKSELRIALKNTQINPEIFYVFKKADVIPYGLKMKMNELELNAPCDILKKLYMQGDTHSILTLDENFYQPIKA